MARVWLPLAATRPGSLPALCAKSGAPAERILAVPARARAGWTWWLLPLGVLPFLLARQFAPQVSVPVPLSERVGRRLDRLRLLWLISLLEAAGLAAAGLLAGRRDGLLAGHAFLAGAALARLLEAALSVRGTLDPSARGVLLSGVHPAFRDAVDRLQRAAWAHAVTRALRPSDR